MSLSMTGIVEEIGTTKTYPKKDKTGNVDITKLKISGKYFTSFAKEQLQGIAVGSNVDVDYTEKENAFDGKKYINNNISVMKLHGTILPLAPETQAKIDSVGQVMAATGTNATDPNFAQNLEKERGTNTVTIRDKTYKVTLEAV